MQRRMERAIRAQKRRVLLAGPEDAAPRKSRLVLLQQEYRSFSDGVGLRTEDERLEVSGFGPKQMKQLPLEKPASSTVLTPEVIKPPEPPELPDPPKSPAPPELPKPERFTDITGNWYPDAKPNSHRVLELQEYTFNEVIYKVDGHNVVLDHDAHEKEIAELLEREVGGELYLVPRVNEPQGVPTPDFLFHGARYDLKTLRGNTQLSTKDKEWQDKLNGMAFDGKIKEAITAAKGRNAKAISALLDVEKLKKSTNQDADIKDALEALKKDNAYLFEDDSTPPPYAGGTGRSTPPSKYDAETAKIMAAAGLDPEKD